MPTTRAAQRGGQIYHNVTNYGAVGDGVTIDSPAINRAIEAAVAQGGGTVYFPPGNYLSYSIRLKSNITLHLEEGAVILAASAPPQDQPGGYDASDPNPEGGGFQDAGHSHWKNSLLWAINEHNISIVGAGMIDGRGLSGAAGGGGGRGRGQGRGRGDGRGDGAATQPGADQPEGAAAVPGEGRRGRGGDGRGGRGRGGGQGGAGASVQPPRAGTGDKALALKNCRNVTIRDIAMFRCGHFCMLLTGVDNLTIDNVTFDTNRDAIDVDACRNVRISNCTVNSPNDDAIVLKSSFGLGEFRPCENVTITNCMVSGFEIGSVLDGTYQVLTRRVPDGQGPTGRIKFGTESNAGFKNITISNIVFDNSRGLALETVDGALLEDVTISNITMRNTSNSPLYLRLGARMRGPEGTPIGKLRRINISNIVVHNADPRFANIIAGIPDNYIEDVKLSNIWIRFKGGGTKEQAEINPPELERDYPEPERHGVMPAYGFFIRHVKNIELSNIDIGYTTDEARPPFVLDDVKGASFNHVRAQKAADAPTFKLKGVENFETHQVKGVQDGVKDSVPDGKF